MLAHVLNHNLLSAHFFAFLFFIITFVVKDCSPLRVVALVVPSSVRTGAAAELSCLYELGNSSLYSLKWFFRANETDLDEQEFFRYTPNIRPHKQYFPLPGITVNLNKSSGDRLLIESTSGQTSGKYKCEISVDGTFQTVAAEKLMTVMGNGAASSLSLHPSQQQLLLLFMLSIFTLDLTSILVSTFSLFSKPKKLVNVCFSVRW